MKYAFILLSFLPVFLSLNISAQTAKPLLLKHRNLKSSEERLVAEADYISSSGTFIPGDSSRYFYSNGRGNYNNFDYQYADDSMLIWRYYPNSGAYRSNGKTIDSFDSHNNILWSISYYVDSNTARYIASSRMLSTYDSNSNMLTSVAQIWNGHTNSWINNGNTLLTYDTVNQFTGLAYQTWDTIANAWVNVSAIHITYRGRYPIYQVRQNWNAVQSIWVDTVQTVDSFTSSGYFVQEVNQIWNTAQAAWFNDTGTFYTYNPDNSENTETTEYWDTVTSAWVPTKRTSFDFSQNYSYVAYYQVYSNNAFVTTSRDTTTLDGSYERISDIIQNWDSLNMVWQNMSQVTNSYDSYRSTTQTISTHWTAGAWLPDSTDMQKNFYYETYTPATGLIETQSVGSLQLYPSPASTAIRMYLNMDEAQVAHIDIYDVSGRLWRQWQTPAGSSYECSIPVSILPTGVYTMCVRGKDVSLAKSFSVVH